MCDFFVPFVGADFDGADFDGETMRNDSKWSDVVSTKVRLCLQPIVYVRSIENPTVSELMSQAVAMPLL